MLFIVEFDVIKAAAASRWDTHEYQFFHVDVGTEHLIFIMHKYVEASLRT